MTRVKICGLKDVPSALIAAEYGADFLGLVFASSKRQIGIETAHEIVKSVKRKMNNPPKITGVFVNKNPKTVNEIAEYCGLDCIQLSGNEDLAYCKLIGKPLIKAVHISSETTSFDIVEKINAAYDVLPEEKVIFLLDTQVRNLYGGTGVGFCRQIAYEVSQAYPVIIAGGLNAENVGELVRETRPWGVDVSSGVETEGQKDREKIIQFINRAKGES